MPRRLLLALTLCVACGSQPAVADTPPTTQAGPTSDPSAKATPPPDSAATRIDDTSVVITKGPIEPISPQQWQANVQEYEARGANARSAEERIELGRWAYEAGLEDEAWEQFALAMAKSGTSSPTIDAYARRAMGVRDAKAGAAIGQNEQLVNAARVRRVRDMGLAFSFTVAIEDDAPPSFFADMQWRLRRMNWFFWRITEGQMFLDTITLQDKTSDGRFVIESGKLDMTLLSGGGAFCMNSGRPDWRVVSAGRVYTRVLAHEMLHGVFGLPDERHGCACIMQGGLYGIRSDQLAMCDVHTHQPSDATPVPCWTLARARYPKLEHPSQGDWGAPPEPKFLVKDS